MIFVGFIPICRQDPKLVKKNNFKTIRCYLRYLTISNSGLLVHQKSNLFYPTSEAIAVPQNVYVY